MAYSLCSELSFCICSERAVFLDLTADRYFCLPSAIDRDFQDWIGERPLSLQSLGKLVELGVLTEREGGAALALQAPIPLPRRDFNDAFSANLLWIIWATCEQLAARMRLRRHSFASIVTGLRKMSATSRAIAGEQAKHARLAAAFAGSRMLMHSHDHCLSHSLAFHRACRRLGLEAVFVIGVRLDPFSAHCWVQCEDLVLNDSVERVQHFTPILAI